MPGKVYLPTSAYADHRFIRLAAALPFGYSLQYFAVREGLPMIFMEYAGDAIAPSGYSIDASLVIDRSARIGCVVDGDSPIAKAFDLEIRLLPTATVNGYFARPTRVARLTTALTAAATSLGVDDARPFAYVSACWVGTSYLPYSGTTDTTITGITSRSFWGRARSYEVGALVTDAPATWKGARWDLYAVALDPSGRYVQDASIFDNASLIWTGYGIDRPVRDGTEWVLTARDQIRRLVDPIGIAASGTAVWSDFDDVLVKTPVDMVYIAKVHLEPTSGSILDINVRPFSTLDGYDPDALLPLSTLRERVADVVLAAATDAQVVDVFWTKRMLDFVHPLWELTLKFSPAATDTMYQLLESYVANANDIFIAFNHLIEPSAFQGSTANEVRPLRLMQPTRVVGVSLAVIVDEGDPASLPTTGMVLIEAGGRVDYARYTDLAVDETDPFKVNVTLEQRDRIFGEELSAILSGERANVSVRFLWADEGSLADVLRRAISSTGDAVNGTYDTLPKGQGLGVDAVDDASFAAVLAGPMSDLNFSVYVDSGSSVADIFGGILRLSRTALATRWDSDAAGCSTSAVDVGSADSGVPIQTIADEDLVTTQGRRPVRVRGAYQSPQSIQVTVHTAPVDDVPAGEASITYRDPYLTDWTGERWELDVYGLERESLITIGTGWAQSLFRSGETRQVLEIDVAPFRHAQVGDVVLLDLTDPSLWDYATQTGGLTGLARVLGSVLSLTSGVVTLTVAADGVLTAGPMCPSLPIVAVDGGASPSTTPATMDVDDSYYDLIEAAKDGNASWTVLVYEPGQDIAYEYTVSTISLTGGATRLTITSYPSSPSVSLATGMRLTWARTEDATTNQARYLHTDDGRQWS